MGRTFPTSVAALILLEDLQDVGRVRPLPLILLIHRFQALLDETIHALEGELVVTLGDGETVTLHPGDIASFVKGTQSTWEVTKPFKKLFIVSG